MNGFLHRLAERATGAAHPLRKAATNLFAPWQLEKVQPQTDTLQPGRINHSPAPAQVSREVATPGPSDQRRTQNVSTKAAQLGAATKEETVDPVMTEHRTQHVSTKPAQPDLATKEEIVDPAMTERRPVASEQSRDTQNSHPASEPPPLMPHASIIVQSAVAEDGSRPGSPLAPQDDVKAEPAESLLSVSAAIARVEPLLPLSQPAGSFVRPIVNASLAAFGRAPASLVEETTEVHVSIGRIEVTAVHEPAPAKPAATRRNAPMSLDDYLAKRHGSRP